MQSMTAPSVDDLDTALIGIRARQREAIAAQRRRIVIRIMRVLIAVGVTIIVVAAFLLGVALVVGAL